MDVTCEQCKAEYDFDDTLLGDKGTTVKCSQCGHVFRVLPRRREPTRSALKVRFAHDGHIEAVGSLRELQQRIQAGEVDVEDELGRDGFTFRKLGDVPELRNFFTRSASSSASTLAAPDAMEKLAVRPDARPKRTVMGVGPNVHDVPTSPRMQGLGPGTLAAQALAPTQPGAPTPKGTLQGRAPIGTTTPSQPVPRDPPSRRVPISSAPTPAGNSPTVPAPALHGISAGRSPSGPPPGTLPETAQRAPGSVAPGMLRVPDSYPPGPARGPDPRYIGSSGSNDSIAPGALKAAARPATTTPAPAAGAGRKVRLRVEDDDAPPERASGGSSKVLLFMALFAVLGVGGYVASRRLAGTGDVLEPTPGSTAGAPELAADASAATSAAPLAEPPATAPADASTGLQVAPSAPADKPAAPTAAAPEPPPEAQPKADKPASKPAPAEKPAARGADKAPEPAAASGGGREPKDYSSWVARGEQLFSRGDMTGARQAFESAVALRASGSEANSGLGSVLVALGQTREAIPFLNRAASNGFAEASVGLGDAHRKLGQTDAAIEAYETYLARLPRGARANYVRLQLEGLGKREKSEEPPRSEPSPRPNNEYRPAGELTEPPPGSAEPKPPSQPAPTENVP
jgi:predicted Zn finger-like uncharacterized protein